MMQIQGCNVTVMVTNMDVSIEFYTKTLGFTLAARYGDHWADIQGPGLAIGLHPARPGIQHSDNMQIGIRVVDLEQAMTALENKGIKFLVKDDEQVRLAHFHDPDQNVLYLVQTE